MACDERCCFHDCEKKLSAGRELGSKAFKGQFLGVYIMIHIIHVYPPHRSIDRYTPIHSTDDTILLTLSLCLIFLVCVFCLLPLC